MIILRAFPTLGTFLLVSLVFTKNANISVRSVVDVFAPGDTIISASFQGDDQGAVLSGTSMATYVINYYTVIVLMNILTDHTSPVSQR